MPKVILSANHNPDYFYYLPITCAAWNYFGFDCIVYIAEDKNFAVEKEQLCRYVYNTTLKNTTTQIYWLPPMAPYRSETIAQISRLFGACVVDKEDEYLITGDIDMIPLNSYLYRDFDKRNLFGEDLTDYTQQPMCYVGMSTAKWKEFLRLESGNPAEQIFSTLQYLHGKAASNKWEEYWDTDQAYLTEEIKQFGKEKFNNILRGRERNGYAFKRVDRGTWAWDEKEEYIDCHMLKNPTNDDNFNKTYSLIQHTLKNYDCTWMPEYHKQFKHLLQQA